MTCASYHQRASSLELWEVLGGCFRPECRVVVDVDGQLAEQVGDLVAGRCVVDGAEEDLGGGGADDGVFGVAVAVLHLRDGLSDGGDADAVGGDVGEVGRQGAQLAVSSSRTRSSGSSGWSARRDRSIAASTTDETITTRIRW